MILNKSFYLKKIKILKYLLYTRKFNNEVIRKSFFKNLIIEKV